MMKVKIKEGESKMRKTIQDKSTTMRAVSPARMAKALGAVPTGIEIDARQGPVSLFTLRQFLADSLYSNGGRPSLKGTRKVRSKISFFNEDWEKLKQLSEYYRKVDGIRVTSSQIAAALLHAQISGVNTPKTKVKSKSA